jgi:hypothetical protein
MWAQFVWVGATNVQYTRGLASWDVGPEFWCLVEYSHPSQLYPPVKVYHIYSESGHTTHENFHLHSCTLDHDYTRSVHKLWVTENALLVSVWSWSVYHGWLLNWWSVYHHWCLHCWWIHLTYTTLLNHQCRYSSVQFQFKNLYNAESKPIRGFLTGGRFTIKALSLRVYLSCLYYECSISI